MVDIESKIEDLLSNSKLIPKADIKQLLENTKKKNKFNYFGFYIQK